MKLQFSTLCLLGLVVGAHQAQAARAANVRGPSSSQPRAIEQPVSGIAVGEPAPGSKNCAGKRPEMKQDPAVKACLDAVKEEMAAIRNNVRLVCKPVAIDPAAPQVAPSAPPVIDPACEQARVEAQSSIKALRDSVKACINASNAASAPVAPAE